MTCNLGMLLGNAELHSAMQRSLLLPHIRVIGLFGISFLLSQLTQVVHKTKFPCFHLRQGNLETQIPLKLSKQLTILYLYNF